MTQITGESVSGLLCEMIDDYMKGGAHEIKNP